MPFMQVLPKPNHCFNISGEGISHQEEERQLYLECELGYVTEAYIGSGHDVIRNTFAARDKHFTTRLNNLGIIFLI